MLLKGAHGGSRKQGINRYGMDLVFRDTQKGNLHISVMIVAFAVIIRSIFKTSIRDLSSVGQGATFILYRVWSCILVTLMLQKYIIYISL